MIDAMSLDDIPNGGFILAGFTLEQVAREFAERGKAIDLMRALCEIVGCTLHVERVLDDDPRLVLSRHA